MIGLTLRAEYKEPGEDVLNKNCRSVDAEFDEAWRLFLAMHDAPSATTAKELVDWVAQGPGHVRAFDDVLTLWALAGGGLAKRSVSSIVVEPGLVQ